MKTAKIFPALLLLLLLAACTAPKGVYHAVQPGQTLYSISRAYNVNEKYLARLNGVEHPDRLRAGQRLFIPGAARKIDVPVHRPAKGSAPVVAASAKRATASPQSSAPSPTDAGKRLPKPAADAPKIAKEAFAWPLQGELLRRFGRTGNRNCNGVEIAAPENTQIVAAAAGQVTYSGDGIRGYGNLIIIRHPDSFFTVYAFNRKNLVSAGVSVQKGEPIALSGSPPTGGAPCLHFEIRQGKAAVDPIFYLP